MNERTKFLFVVLIAVIVGVGSFAAFGIISNPPSNGLTNSTTTTTTVTTTTTEPVIEPIDVPDPLSFEGVDICWIAVEGIKLKFGDTVVYIDPHDTDTIEGDPFLEPADYIIITHDHTPHFNLPYINAVSGPNTIRIAPRIVAARMREDFTVYPGDTLEFDNVTFDFVPSYNVNKYRDNGQLFHPPSYDSVGVIVDFNRTRIYHAGDTDRIPEMQNIVTDIALLPVSGYAWMTPNEAAGAVDDLKNSSDLQYAVPIHWGHNQGTRWHAERFEELANCTVVILDRLII